MMMMVVVVVMVYLRVISGAESVYISSYQMVLIVITGTVCPANNHTSHCTT